MGILVILQPSDPKSNNYKKSFAKFLSWEYTEDVSNINESTREVRMGKSADSREVPKAFQPIDGIQPLLYS